MEDIEKAITYIWDDVIQMSGRPEKKEQLRTLETLLWDASELAKELGI